MINQNTSIYRLHFKIANTFISEILRIWTDIKYEANIDFTEELKAQSSLIRVGNRPIHYRSRSLKGVRNFGHLMEHSTNFLS